ncbi:MAG: ABC transporter ATP-binding protein [Spirochaetaceae bacterium]|jgi:ABC-type lipoprotein export system ATPase subunit|nr:ABC transporter ATP-binding protein [Spirochaetaceae bacterium]
MIQFHNVSFTVQTNTVLTNCNISFEEGKFTAITGPAGSGKSTTLKLAAGILQPTKGRVLYNGEDISEMSESENRAFRRNMGFVFQDSALWENQSLRQNLELPLQFHFPKMSRADMNRRIASSLALAGWNRASDKKLDIRPAELSMGEQKLISFARAILLLPRLLFLDEWTESLDESAAERLITVVENMKNGYNTVIFVSHDDALVQRLADRVVEIQ